MGQTPEGRVKKAVTLLLTDFRSRHGGIYWFMPVPSGYGQSSLDYLGCCRGKFFAIETKAPGKAPTDRQTTMIKNIQFAGGRVFVIAGEKETHELKAWLLGLIE